MVAWLTIVSAPLSPILPAPWIVSLVLVSVTPLPRRNAAPLPDFMVTVPPPDSVTLLLRLTMGIVAGRAVDEERPVVREGGAEVSRRAVRGLVGRTRRRDGHAVEGRRADGLQEAAAHRGHVAPDDRRIVDVHDSVCPNRGDTAPSVGDAIEEVEVSPAGGRSERSGIGDAAVASVDVEPKIRASRRRSSLC